MVLTHGQRREGGTAEIYVWRGLNTQDTREALASNTEGEIHRTHTKETLPRELLVLIVYKGRNTQDTKETQTPNTKSLGRA